MDECLDALEDARLFSTLDPNGDLWQIDVDPSDRGKTKFTFHDGLYLFNNRLFGLENIPVTFQPVMVVIFSLLN